MALNTMLIMESRWCELRKYKRKWRYGCRSGNCKLTRKNFGTSTGFKPMVYQLNYENPHIHWGNRQICWIHLSREWNETLNEDAQVTLSNISKVALNTMLIMEWRWCELRKYKLKWRYDRRSGNCMQFKQHVWISAYLNLSMLFIITRRTRT